MPCRFPMRGYRSKHPTANGKFSFTFDPKQSAGDKLDLPCGRCIECRKARALQWTIRCVHERQLWRHNWFVTLTYRPEDLPKNAGLDKRGFQLFMKRLRFNRGNGVRYFAAGEYGGDTRRPHYHAILFNCELPDLKYDRPDKNGFPVYKSKTVEDAWGAGFVDISETTPANIGYVARYCVDKLGGPQEEDFLTRHGPERDGSVVKVPPEFLLMSRGTRGDGGIGMKWIEKYGEQVLAQDVVRVNGRDYCVPRAYNDYLKANYGDEYDLLLKRRNDAENEKFAADPVKYRHERSRERRLVMEYIAEKDAFEHRKKGFPDVRR